MSLLRAPCGGVGGAASSLVEDSGTESCGEEKHTEGADTRAVAIITLRQVAAPI
jgi:hypothetical protein